MKEKNKIGIGILIGIVIGAVLLATLVTPFGGAIVIGGLCVIIFIASLSKNDEIEYQPLDNETATKNTLKVTSLEEGTEETCETEQTLNAFAITSFVLGIVSALGLYWLFAIPPILAIVFGVLGIDRINYYRNEKGKGLAIAGLVLGIVYAIAFFIKIILYAIS